MTTISYQNGWDELESITKGWMVHDAPSPSRLRKMYWQGKRSVPEIGKITETDPQVLYELMRQNGIPRRSRTEANYLVYRDKPQFNLRRQLTPEQERLKTAGLMLYWAEGAKRNRNMVDLANSDPRIVSIFLRFLREICGVAESRLRVYTYVYEGQDVDAIRRYWSQVTGIPISQFFKPYISKFRMNRARRRVLPHGVAHIRYSDTRLQQQLLSWIDEESQDLSPGRCPSG